MATVGNNRYNYMYTPQYSVLGTNTEQQLGPENLDWNQIIQQIYQTANLTPPKSGVNNSYRLSSPSNGQVKPLYEIDNTPTSTDKLGYTTGKLLDEYNPEKVNTMIQTGKQAYNTVKPLFTNPNAGTTASNAGNTTTTATNGIQQTTQNIDKGTQGTQGGATGGSSGANLGAGVGIAAGIAKTAYNMLAPDLYTSKDNDAFTNAVYNGAYGGGSNEDPLKRLVSIFNSNEDRMKHTTDYAKSLASDYGNVHNSDVLANSYREINQDPIEYKSFGTELADHMLAGAQGALNGLSYTGGNAWGALGGAILGHLFQLSSLAGRHKRIDMVNEALTNTKKENDKNFYDTDTRNFNDELLNILRNSYMDANSGFLRKFDNGGYLEEGSLLNEFNAGGSHEQNPFGGIQQGIASDGNPNLVEEGEIRSDFDSAKIFNNRPTGYTITEKDCEEYNLPKSVSGCNPAEAIKKLKKEYDNRVNDPISIATMKEWDARVFQFQEDKTAEKEAKRLTKEFNALPKDAQLAIAEDAYQQQLPLDELDLSQPVYAKGGKIHIKPSKKGTFTAAAKKHDKSVQAFSSQVLAHPENYSPAMRKKANFARNSAKWKHEDGGHLFPYGSNLYPTTNGFGETIYPTYTLGVNTSLSVDPRYNPTLMQFDSGLDFNTLYNVNKALDKNNTAVNNTKIKEKSNNDNIFNLEYLRYAPAVGAGLGALTAWLQPKDYYLADALRDISTQYKPIAAPHVGGKRKAKTYDVNLGNAENLAMQSAALRANRSNANRGQQTAGAIGLINAFEKQNALRNLEWQRANEAAELENAKYNLAIDQFNAQQDAAADRLNTEINNRRIAALMSAAQAEDTANNLWKQNVSGTTENFFNQLGNVGRDTWNQNQMLMSLAMLDHEKLVEVFGSEAQAKMIEARLRSAGLKK